MYQVQFVGVVCFFRQNGSRVALVPDGRQFKPRHVARIVVDPAAVVRESGWARREADVVRGVYVLPRCTIRLQGADQPGPLDSSAQDPRLPRLQVLQPSFRVDPNSPNVLARVDIRQGTLEGFRFPNTLDQPNVSVISQLTVDHEGEIGITITPATGADRTIVLRPGTEIAIVNDSTTMGRDQHHFHIYDLLNGNENGITVGETPPPHELGVIPVSRSTHHVFNGPINGDDSCPNTGCCP